MRISYAAAIGFGLVGLPAGLMAGGFLGTHTLTSALLALLAVLGTLAIALCRLKIAIPNRAISLRTSTRAGCLTIGIAAAMVLLGLRMRLGQEAALLGMLPVLATMLPAISLSLLVTALLPLSGKAQASGRAASAAAGKPNPLILKLAAVSLMVIGFSSPFIKGFRSVPPPVTPLVIVHKPIPIDPKTLLPFQEKDLTPETSLDTASVVQCKLKSVDSIGDRIAGADVDLAPDGRTFAYLRKDLKDLMIVDLQGMKIISRVTLDMAASLLRFSPDAKRLLVITNPELPSVVMVEVATGKITSLPRTLRAAVPSLPFAWWSDNEILLQNPATPAFFLLDTLESISASAVPAWENLPASEKQAWLKADRFPNRIKARFNCVGVEVPMATFHPLHEGTPDWQMSSTVGWCLVDLTKVYAKPLPALPHDADSKLLPILDGKAFLHLHANTTEILSFTTEAEPVLSYAVEMPHDPKHEDCSPDVPSALAEHSLVALVYPSLRNPLTGQVVGPDRSRVKAVVRFAEWHDTKATVLVEAPFAAIQPGDVIADALRWSGTKPILLARISPFTPWWAELQTNDTPPSGLASHLSLQDRKPGFEFFASSPDALSEDADQTATLPLFPHNVRFVNCDPRELPKIRRFVEEHHHRVSNGDIEKMVEDFGNTVRPYYTHAELSRQQILEDERKLTGETLKVTETIEGIIQIGMGADRAFEAIYRVKAQSETKLGKVSVTHRDMALRLLKTTAGFQIVGCNARKVED